jgi:hypothetical protein
MDAATSTFEPRGGGIFPNSLSLSLSPQSLILKFDLIALKQRNEFALETHALVVLLLSVNVLADLSEP